MTYVVWEIRGQKHGVCSCGCPCEFNAGPTRGDCRGPEAQRIVGGLADFARRNCHAALWDAHFGPSGLIAS